MKSRKGILALLVAVMALAGCGRTEKATLETYEKGEYRPETVTAFELTGARDGATTHATATYTLADGNHVRVELQVGYNPTPVLNEGHWYLDARQPEEGEVRAESVKFLGGQGSSPSVGGSFWLTRNGAPRFRAVIPAQPLPRAFH
ncbi:MAG TPA: hypothetical protein VFH88_15495 [Candidatus Krumholzibacteria bacterium]|nr:hypothetical protein [Candidatus Krumholzibacteria bacterium]